MLAMPPGSVNLSWLTTDQKRYLTKNYCTKCSQGSGGGSLSIASTVATNRKDKTRIKELEQLLQVKKLLKSNFVSVINMFHNRKQKKRLAV